MNEYDEEEDGEGEDEMQQQMSDQEDEGDNMWTREKKKVTNQSALFICLRCSLHLDLFKTNMFVKQT